MTNAEMKPTCPVHTLYSLSVLMEHVTQHRFLLAVIHINAPGSNLLDERQVLEQGARLIRKNWSYMPPCDLDLPAGPHSDWRQSMYKVAFTVFDDRPM